MANPNRPVLTLPGAKTQAPEPMTAEGIVRSPRPDEGVGTAEPTVTAVGGAEVAMVQIPTDIYDEALSENSKRSFTLALLEARNPPPKPVYVPPALSPGMMTQRELEMAAGAKRVAEFAANEATRKATMEAHKNDRWQNPGTTVSVFRPADYVPDQRKGQGNVGGSAVNV